MSKWVAVIVVGIFVPSAWAQATGSILGTVSDTTGGVVVGARVSATNVNTNVSREAVTNHAGYYQIDNLLPGEYIVNTEMAGFKKALRPQPQLQVAQAARLEQLLEVGAVSQPV